MIVVGDTDTLATITPRTPGLLVVALETLRHIVVDDVAHIGLVYTHTEGDGSDDDVDTLFDEGILVLSTLLGVEPCMVGQSLDPISLEHLGEVHHLRTAHAVDDPTLLGVAEDEADDLPLHLRSLGLYLIEEVRSVERALEDNSCLHP